MPITPRPIATALHVALLPSCELDVAPRRPTRWSWRTMGVPCLVVVVVVTGFTGCGRRHFDELVDSDPCASPPAGCPSPTVYACGDQCFLVCDQQVIQPEAAGICMAWGGCLATMTDQVASDCAASRLTTTDGWAGMVQSPLAVTPEEGWSWCDGTALGFTRWETSALQPNDDPPPEDGDEQCGSIQVNGTWADAPCDSSFRSVVCSRPL